MDNRRPKKISIGRSIQTFQHSCFAFLSLSHASLSFCRRRASTVHVLRWAARRPTCLLRLSRPCCRRRARRRAPAEFPPPCRALPSCRAPRACAAAAAGAAACTPPAVRHRPSPAAVPLRCEKKQAQEKQASSQREKEARKEEKERKRKEKRKKRRRKEKKRKKRGKRWKFRNFVGFVVNLSKANSRWYYFWTFLIEFSSSSVKVCLDVDVHFGDGSW
ncbi:uncharacterized protein LOC133889636 [Phragmites australis]|uniref:uncharacterized protein LOC133889636 n=1 Tax=Phragmites australis TaxID=29695 RepID=UPI002D784E40|nr:uncharacterized protein LOC133889636 [Phragmites australis]